MKNNIFVIITFVFWGLFSVTAIRAQETTITVTDCTQFSGVGTISDAIAIANIGGGTINFACDEGTVITFADEFTITNTVMIDGGGAITFDGDNSTHFFIVNRGESLTLNNITLQNGRGDLGGAIYNSGDLTITNSILLDNFATRNGGAIYNYDGTITLTDNMLSDNASAYSGGTIYNYEGNLSISNSTLFGSSASDLDGGVIFNLTGTVTLNNVILSNNSAFRVGGAIFNRGDFTISNSILSDNYTSYNGGAIFNAGNFTISNSTLSDNFANGDGGAIYIVTGITTISDSILSNNSADKGGAIFNANGIVYSQTTYYSDNTCTGDVINNGGNSADIFSRRCPTTADVLTEIPLSHNVTELSGMVLGCVFNNTDGAGDNTYCRLLMQNGAVVDFNGAIPADLISLGVILAVDVYRLQGGMSQNTFPDYARVCLAGQGRLFYMDGRNAPRVSIELAGEFVDGLTCGWIPAPGTLILTN